MHGQSGETKIKQGKDYDIFEVGNLEPKKVTWKISTVWVLLAALGSILMLSTTSLITQEVAPIPFLWVVPLSVYLISFIITFSNDRWYIRSVVWRIVILF